MTMRGNGPHLNQNTAESTRRWYNELPIQWDPDYCHVMYDFLEVDDDQTNLYTVVKDAGAAVGIAADAANGILTLTSAATTDDDGASIQGNEIILPATSRRIWFETRVKKSDADQSDLFAGLTVNFATNPEAVLTASNRIGFQIDDGNASVLCKTEASDVETSTDSQVDAVDDTYITLGLVVIGTQAVEFYVNRVLVATHTTNIPATELTWAAFHLSGNNTGTHTSNWDYIFAAWSR